jgi:hypothetical protein
VTVAELIEQLRRLSPSDQVLLSIDDSYYGNVDHDCVGATEGSKPGIVLLLDHCNYSEKPAKLCRGYCSSPESPY